MGSLFRDDEDFDVPIDSLMSPESTKLTDGLAKSDSKFGSLERDNELMEFESSKTDLEDDSEQLIIHDESTLTTRSPRLKRLKKGLQAPRDLSMGSLFRDEEDFNIPIKSLNSPQSTKSDDGPLESDPSSPSQQKDKESEEFDRLFPWEGAEKQGAKRALNFGEDDDDTDARFNGVEDTEKGEGGEIDRDWDGFWEDKEKRKRDEGADEEISEGKKKKNRKKGDKSRRADSESKRPKRKVQEEKAQFTNFQRELRERKDVAFKPVLVAPKPLSSVLEKIRQRKLNLSRKASFSSNEYSESMCEFALDVDSDDGHVIKGKDTNGGGSVSKKLDSQQTAKVDHPISPSSIEKADGSPQPNSGQKTPVTSSEENEDNQPAFRAPANDTQDLFSDSEARNSQDEHSDKEMGSPLDEDLAPSLPSMNLKLDSAPVDDISDDDEYSDKESANPSSELSLETSSPPKGDPVKAFVDDEASEEDDSDNDRMRFGDDEEGDDDEEEVADLIATNYSEKPVDHDKRNELHQKWLEQQDEAGTDNILHKYGLKEREITFFDFDEEGTNAGEADDKDGGEEADDDSEEIPTANRARFTTKQWRQMIPRMFADNDEGGYVSSEDEETEKRLVKQQLLGKIALEEKVTFVSPAVDEASRDAFGRVKKLNTVHQTKKKTKITSFFEANLTKGKVFNSSSKSSFLHRASSISVSSNKKNGSGVTRGFIFGRDDSNSRSSLTVQEEESSEVIDPALTSSKTKRTIFGAKYGGSQARMGSQQISSFEGSMSLFDVLSRSSAHSRDSFAVQDETIDQQAVFAAMKATAMRSVNI